MRVDQGTTNVSSAGTAVQMNNVTNRVKHVIFKALAGNSGLTYVGVSDVAAALGYELSAGNEIEINFGEQGGTVPFSTFYVDVATNNDKIAWSVILDG